MKRLKQDWVRCGSDLYHLKRLFDCDPSKIIENGVVMCPYGGLFLRYRESPSFLDVFSNTGAKVISRNFNFVSNVRCVFWCSGGRVGVVRGDGEIVVAYLSGEVIERVKAVDRSNVMLAYPVLNGVAIVTQSRLFCVYDFTLSRYEVYHKIEGKERVSAVCFVKGAYDTGFVALNDGSVLCVKKGSSHVITVLDFVPQQIWVSPNCVNMAACAKQVSCVFPCEIKGNVKSLKFFCSSFAWLSDNSFIAVGDKSRVMFMELPHVRQQVEGGMTAEKVMQDEQFVRIISKSGLYLMQKVPDELMSVVDDPSVVLFVEARDLFKRRSANAYLKYKEVTPETIERMLTAALHCLEPAHQEQLLSLAAWGHNSPNYLDRLHDIRMFNTLRTSQLGFACPASALCVFSPMHVIDLLLQLEYFDCASKLCQMFGYGQTMVIENWALQMIDKHGEKALPLVLSKLTADPFIDYKRIAENALRYHISEKGLLELARGIRYPKDRTIFEMQIGATNMLQTALNSLDGNAIATALYSVMMTLSKSEFYNVLKSNRYAFHCFTLWRQLSHVREPLRVDGYPRLFATEHLLVNEVLASKRLVEDQIMAIQDVPLPTSFVQEPLSNQIQLLHILEDKQAIRAIGARSTPRQFLAACITHDDKETAKKICDLYHISQRAYATLTAQTYAKLHRWREFEALTYKKGQLPLETYAQLSMLHGNKSLAIQIADRIVPADRKAEFMRSLT